MIEKYVLKTKNTGSKIASVAVVKADTVKVCAKRGGTAYIYAVDLGSGKFEEFVVTVKEAPSKLDAYVDTEKQTSVFSVYVNTVDEKKIYIKEIPSDKKLKIDPDCTYTVKAQTKKNSEHFEVGTVQRDSEGRPYFTVRAKDIVKNGYFIYRIYNDQSGQYAAVRVHTVNPLVDIYGKADKDNINKKGEVMTVNIDLILKDKNQPSGDSFTAIAMTDDPKFNKDHTTYSYHAAKSVRATVSKDGTKITITVIKDITEPITIRLMRRDAETKSVFPHYIKTLYPENWKPNDSQNKTEP